MYNTHLYLHLIPITSKLKKIELYGQLVDVKDGKMHVYSMGSGDQTVVILPGMGIALPSSEYRPFMRELSKKYTVVAIDYFGMGFSTVTSEPRTTKNYVEEIRLTLKESGFNKPYLLMPHSISSVYSEYYASTYPAELICIISLDGTSTAYYDKIPNFIRPLLSIGKFQQATGITSLLAPLSVNKEENKQNGYTDKETADAVTFSGFTINNNLLDQTFYTGDYIQETMELNYPQSVPYLKLTSKQTYEKPNKQLKITPQQYQYQHLERLGKAATFEVLNGNHFIYRNNVKEIAEMTDGFLEKAHLE